MTFNYINLHTRWATGINLYNKNMDINVSSHSLQAKKKEETKVLKIKKTIWAVTQSNAKGSREKVNYYCMCVIGIIGYSIINKKRHSGLTIALFPVPSICYDMRRKVHMP